MSEARRACRRETSLFFVPIARSRAKAAAASPVGVGAGVVIGAGGTGGGATGVCGGIVGAETPPPPDTMPPDPALEEVESALVQVPDGVMVTVTPSASVERCVIISEDCPELQLKARFKLLSSFFLSAEVILITPPDERTKSNVDEFTVMESTELPACKAYSVESDGRTRVISCGTATSFAASAAKGLAAIVSAKSNFFIFLASFSGARRSLPRFAQLQLRRRVSPSGGCRD